MGPVGDSGSSRLCSPTFTLDRLTQFIKSIDGNGASIPFKQSVSSPAYDSLLTLNAVAQVTALVQCKDNDSGVLFWETSKKQITLHLVALGNLLLASNQSGKDRQIITRRVSSATQLVQSTSTLRSAFMRFEAAKSISKSKGASYLDHNMCYQKKATYQST
jgi:hypothetical protein